jgi:pyrophosphatase PpaX
MPDASRPIAVLFDLDGTLIDSIGLLLACVHHAFADFPGRRPTEEEWIAGIGTPLWSQMAAYTDSEEQVRELTHRYRSFQRERHDELTTLYPGTLDVVQALAERGHPMAIVTSKSNEMMHRALEHTGIARYMTSAIGADSCTVHKPDPFPVRLALQELDRGAHEAVFVGDSPHDMNAGNSAGVVTVAALWGPFTRDQLRPTNPTYWLDRITGLPAIVEQVQQRVEVGAAG